MILLCFVLGTTFLFLPFLPSFVEVLRPSDSQALKISNQILRDPRASPSLLYWHFVHLLGMDSLETMEAAAKVDEHKMLNNTILAVPSGKVGAIPKSVVRVVSAGSIELAPKTAYLSKIVSFQSIETGTENAINEIHAKKRLVLAPKTKVIWWATAAEILLKDRSSVPGKIQATESIQVDGRVDFHHLEAPSIRTATEVSSVGVPEFIALPLNLKRNSYSGDFELKANETLEGDLIVKGNLILHANSKVVGSIKCHRKTVLEAGSSVTGNIVSLGDLECHGRNWIGGAVLGQKRASFKGGVYLGSSNNRTTLSAETIEIEGPFQSHGTLRAWKRGLFKT